MSSVLKGNFTPKNDVKANKPENAEERFEKKALKRLGGSIAYVSRKRVNWDIKDQK